ncbi:unnamed protein product [Chrysoparadoxa australica]
MRARLVLTPPPMHQARRLQTRIVDWARWLIACPSFERTMAGAILLNCVLLAVISPTKPDPEWYVVLEHCFNVLFLAEMIVKMTGLGVAGYFKNGWNWVDFAVVVEGAASWWLTSSTELSFVRAMRLLRPLRAVRRFPSLLHVVNACTNSLTSLAGITSVFLFTLIIFSALGVVLWSGDLKMRCYSGGVAMYDGDLVCGVVSDGGGCARLNSFAEPYTCRCEDEHGPILDGGLPVCRPGATAECITPEPAVNPEGGFVSFDNIWRSMLVVFQVTTLEAWSDVCFQTQNATDEYTFFVFLLIILGGNIIILNLVIASLWASFAKHPTRMGLKTRTLQTLSETVSAAMARSGQQSPLNGESKVDLSKDDIENGKGTSPSLRWRLSQINCHLGSKVQRAVDVYCYRGLPPTHPLRRQVMEEGSAFNKFMTGAIVVNIVAISFGGYGVSQDVERAVEIVELIVSVIFIAEALIKLASLGLDYFFDRFNILDFAIAVGAVVEIVIGVEKASKGSLRSLKLIRLFRALRVLRVARVARNWESFTCVYGMILETWPLMLPIMGLLLIFMYIWAILGMQLFGAAPPDDDQRIRFDNFWWSSIQVFFVVSGENWVEIMRYGMANTNFFGCWYSITLIIIGQFWLLSLVLAVVLSPASDEEMDVRYRRQQLRRQVVRVYHRQFLRIGFEALVQHMERARHRNVRRVPSPAAHSLVFIETPRGEKALLETRTRIDFVPSCKKPGSRRATLDSLPTSLNSHWKVCSHSRSRLLQEKAVFAMDKIFGARVYADEDWMPHSMFPLVRSKCRDLAANKWFDRVMVLLVVVSSMTLLRPGAKENVLEYLLPVFTAEIIMRVAGFSLWVGPNGLMRDPRKAWWNMLDILLVLIQVPYHISRGHASLTVVLALRPLRVIARMPELQHVVHSLALSLRGITSLAAILLLAWFSYSLVGMQLYAGEFASCNDPVTGEAIQDVTARYGIMTDGVWVSPPCSGTWLNSLGEEEERTDVWESPPFNYDNIWNSLVSSFIVSSVSGWSELWWAALDATGPDKQPRPYANPWSFLYFAFGLVFFGFYLTQLFIGVITAQFLLLKARGQEGYLLSGDERRWMDYQNRLEGVKPCVLVRQPIQHWRHPAYAITKSRIFKRIVILLLVVNLIVICSEHNGQSSREVAAHTVAHYVLTCCFVLEASIKIAGLGRAYWRYPQNIFDFIVTAVGVADMAIQLTVCSASDNSIFKLVRALRIFRVARLMLYIPNIGLILKTMSYPLPAILRIMMLLTMLLFLFAALGNLLFGNAQIGGEQNQYSDFSSVGAGMMLLFIAVTRDNWTDHLQDLISQGFKWGAILFYTLFMFLVSFITLALFVMVIVEAFDLLLSDGRAVAEEMIPHFKRAWRELDPDGQGTLSYSEIRVLLRVLPKPLGLGQSASHKRVGAYVRYLHSMHGYDRSFTITLVALSALMFSDMGHDISGQGRSLKETLAAVTLQAYARVFLERIRAKSGRRGTLQRPKGFFHEIQGALLACTPTTTEMPSQRTLIHVAYCLYLSLSRYPLSSLSAGVEPREEAIPAGVGTFTEVTGETEEGRLGSLWKRSELTKEEQELVDEALLEQCASGDVAAVSRLLCQGADPSCRDCDDTYKRLPIHLAVMSMEIPIIKQLLRWGADPDSRDGMGRTPLHYAWMTGGADSAISSLLQQHGADCTARDAQGLTPAELQATISSAGSSEPSQQVERATSERLRLATGRWLQPVLRGSEDM